MGKFKCTRHGNPVDCKTKKIKCKPHYCTAIVKTTIVWCCLIITLVMRPFFQRYFCGNDRICSKQCDSEAALSLAFRNIEKYFTVVGLLEERAASFKYLEWKFPHIFTGYEAYMDIHANKKDSSLDSRSGNDVFLREVYCKKRSHECTLYEFVKKRFHNQLQDMYNSI